MTAAALAAWFALAAVARAQTTEIVSVSSSGAQGNGGSRWVSLSADGRCVVFNSGATNLVSPDTNPGLDIYLHDRATGTTERINVDSQGAQAGPSENFYCAISGDGRRVAFDSTASNLVAGDTNGAKDVFVRDRVAGTTIRASVGWNGGQGNSLSGFPVIASGGSSVGFSSSATNLVLNDNNFAFDVFVHDLASGQTSCVSVTPSGATGNSDSAAPTLSSDGRYVSFGSDADDLVPGDNNGEKDVFVHDRTSGTTTRASVSSTGLEGNDYSYNFGLSGDGRYVLINSAASNLVPGDTNGRDDIFVHDRQAATTVRVSVDAFGVQANGACMYPAMTPDARFITYQSSATNLTAWGAGILVHDRATGRTWNANWTSSGAISVGGVYGAAIAADPRFVAFESLATDLVAGHSGFYWDVFVRTHVASFRDTDGDGWGSAGDFTYEHPLPPGYVAVGGDCDDANASVHPGAMELADCLDNDCDGSTDALGYCTAGTTTNGCLAHLRAIGAASASAATTFELRVENVEGNKPGLIFYGLSGPLAVAWGASTSYLCVKSPTQRTQFQFPGGSAGSCDGVLAVDWNAYVAAHPGALGVPFGAGQVVHAQGWFRDPPAPKTTSLSDAVEFHLCPR